MSINLQDLVSALPEVYQTIYGHPEWDGNVSRDCNERLDVIGQVYDTLSRELGRPLRVLDLGCAQGFFSLSLASKGASVQGIDFLQENIDVCNALAHEHPDLSISFSIGRIEEVIEQLEAGQYDLAIGLSVFHHIVHQHGLAQVKTWIQHLADSVHGLIVELALKEEPLYWGPSQPGDPRELIEQCSFYHQLATFDTHLSAIARPMYFISNDHLIFGEYCQPFTRWSVHPYAEAGLAHKGSRRYYFSPEIICKLYYFSTTSGNLLPRESARNRTELENEIAFLSNPAAGFPAPRLISSGLNEVDGWLVMERFPGKLLMDKIKLAEPIDADALLGQVLEQLVILEQNGQYHDDLRTWNIMVDDRQQARIIDYGSITPLKQDCVWPEDLFQSFAILVNEIVIPESVSGGFLRPAALSPFNLPTPYANWLYAFWQQPTADWSFALLQALFLKKSTLPGMANALSAIELWIGAQEKVMMHNQTHIHLVDALVNDCHTRVNNCLGRVVELEQHLDQQRVDQRVTSLEQALLALQQRIPPLPPAGANNAAAFDPLQHEVLTRRLEDAEGHIAQSANENGLLAGELAQSATENGLLAEELAKSATENDRLADALSQSAIENGQLAGELAHWASESTRLASELAHYAGENSRLAGELARMAAENDRLHRHIQAMLHSRSWKMTAWWRKVGQPIKTTVNQPIGKKTIRYILTRLSGFIRRRPALKRAVLRTLRVTGLYNLSLKFYQRCFPVTQHEPEVVNSSHDEVLISYNDDSQRPPLVEEIYLKIKK